MDEFVEWKAEQARKYFKHVRELRSLERLYRNSIDTVREIVRGIDYSRPVVSHSPYPDAIPDAVIQLEALENRYAIALSELAAERTRAELIIDKLGDVRYREVLTYYYLNGLPWRTVAEKMNYEIRSCTRLAREALSEAYWDIPRELRNPIPKAY